MSRTRRQTVYAAEVAAVKPQLTQVHRSKPRQPRLFKIIILNDDYTPMDFVVNVLQRFFYFSRERATQLTLEIHHQGRGVCGVFSKDVAETKAMCINRHSRNCKHPLLCIIEPSKPC